MRKKWRDRQTNSMVPVYRHNTLFAEYKKEDLQFKKNKIMYFA